MKFDCLKKRGFVTGAMIKTAVMLALLVASIVLFTRFPESQLEPSMLSIDILHPWARVIQPSPAALEVLLRLQAARSPPPGPSAGTSVVLQVVSGSTCPANVSASTRCVLTGQLASDAQVELSTTFILDPKSGSSLVSLSTNSSVPIAVALSLQPAGYAVGFEVAIAAVILLSVYAVISLELIHRTLAAMIGAFAALAALSNIRERPTFLDVLFWIDWETLGLLFGMMILVGIFSSSGFFEYSAVRLYKLSRGRLWLLVSMLCFFTAVLSAFLDNVTTVLLLVPVTLQLCHVLDLEPVLIVMSLVFFSNVGGTATAIGDPPNILLVSDASLRAHSPGLITFGTMTAHLAPAAVLCLIVTWGITSFYFHSRVDRQPSQGKMNEVLIWKRTASRVGAGTPEEMQVKRDLLRHIETLERAAHEEMKLQEVREVDVSELERRYPIRDWPLFINSAIVVGIVIILFFLHSFVEIHLTLAWIANIGAMALMLVSGSRDIEEVLEHVEWATLIFFAGLFIMMRALDELGLIQFVGMQVASMIETVPAGGSGRLAAAVTVIIWVTGLGSAFIDNIPFAQAMIPVVLQLASEPLNLPLGPLVWSLALGACLGGNGTLIGASANVVAAGLLESAGHHLSFVKFFAKGMPVALVTLAVSNVYMLVFHVAIPWY